MHPRSPYASARPDFAALARSDATFATLVRWHSEDDARLDWSDPRALIELCRVLLQHDFGVRWTMPVDALCPTVPSRLNYLLWIEDLLALRTAKTEEPIIGLDIGTGASCIYPLLGSAHLGWRFVATEVDPASVLSARHNVALNSWEGRIEIRQVHAETAKGHSQKAELPATSSTSAAPALCCMGDATVEATGGINSAAEDAEMRREAVLANGGHGTSSNAPILVGVIKANESYAFSMCNPPWFAPHETPQPNRAMRPHARCAASDSELYTDGGEARFIARMAADSSTIRERVVWYTSLVGRRASVHAALQAVRRAGAVHVRSTEISQGSTSRWAVAWSFCANAAPRAMPPATLTRQQFAAPAGLSVAEVAARVRECVRTHLGGSVDLDDGVADAEEGAPALSGDAAQGVGGAAQGVGDAADDNSTVVLVTRGHVHPERVQRDAEAAHVGGKRARAGEGAGSHHPAEWIFKVRIESQEAKPACVTVDLVATSDGEASSAFWRLAGEVRNDVVRDTRKWRRQQQRQQKEVTLDGESCRL